MNKIYLVTGYSRESYDDTSIILDAFVDKELAEKVANGFEDIDDSLITLWEIKKRERDARISDLEDDATEDEYAEIYEEYEKYDVYYTFFYQVKEVNLMNYE